MLESTKNNIVVACQGNPGALQVFKNILQSKGEDSALRVSYAMESRRWPGWTLWVAYKDYASKDLEKTIEVMCQPTDDFLAMLSKEGLPIA